MSTIIMTMCWPLQGMSATQKAVLISLADNANDKGVCWPSVARIAERTCLSERAVQKAIKWLEDSCLLSRKQRFGRSTYYVLTPELYAPRTTCTPEPCSPPPPNHVHPTPEPRSPRTVIEPSSEPSKGADAPCTPDAKQTRKPHVPFQAIVDLFNETLPELPTVVLINKGRKETLRARWSESQVHQDIGFWEEFFEMVRASDFLMGKTKGRDGKPFRATFDWLIAPSNFVKVVEGNYHA